MWEKSNSVRIKRKTVLCLVVILLVLAGVTPVLADFLGPDRTVVEKVSSCKIILYKCQYVSSKGIWKYKSVNSWLCSNESKPWTSYPSKPSSQGCFSATQGDTYWEKDQSIQDVTKTYPPATINSSLSCSLNNGWCAGTSQLDLSGDEPLSGYDIIGIEGTLNGQNFACPDSDCSVPLLEGDNALTFWALSSWGDSSTLGTLTAKVDSQLPVIAGSFNGSSGSNGWYLSSVSFDGSAFDATSGLANFSCTLDGVAVGSCTSISVNGEGAHTLVLVATDNAGNTRTVNQDISIDTQNPTLKAALNGTLGANNWYTAAALEASATDPSPGSGLSIIEYNLDNTGWISFPASGVLALPDGKHSVDIRASDQAGHTASSSKSYSLDSSAPDITINPNGTLGTNNWYITSLDLAASASDNTSGMDVFEYSLDNSAWTTYTTPLTLNDGSHNISFWAQDQAGLVTQVDRVYQVDTRAPQIAGSIGGVPGSNGWYVSDVLLGASAADPLPGSGIETFLYSLDGGAAAPFTGPLTIPDGQHTIQLTVQDQAGLTYSTTRTINVDTIHPSLNVITTLPGWVKGSVTFTGTAADTGSGISKVEISTDGALTWQPVSGTTSWNYGWDTLKSPNGIQNIHIRVTDNAGLTTDQALNVGVDNNAPNVSLPNSWYQWQTVTLDVWDDHSGLSETRVEISDPKGRWPDRVIQLDIAQFPLAFKWDRRFGDNTIAPYGTYDVGVIALDKLGNTTHRDASITILLDILPAGPTATPQPYTRPTSTPTLASTPMLIPSTTATQATEVSTFGEIEPTAASTATPVATSTPRATPTQTGVLDWLESIFVSKGDSEDQVTKIEYSESQSTDSASSDAQPPILWGAVAAAMTGAMISYAQEERRKEEQEKMEKLLLQAEKRANEEKLHEQKMEKLEAQWAQEKLWEEARKPKDFGEAGVNAKIDRIDEQEEAAWIAAQEAIRKKEEDRKKKEEERKKAEELKEGLAAYYNASQQGNATIQTEEKSWWENTVDWIDDHQTEIALGVGVAVGVAAIVLSGGVATPLVAAAWMAGAAVVAGTVVAGGTIALNAYYERDWDDNLVGNIVAAGAAAAVVTGAGFLFQAVAGGVSTYCTANPAACSHIEPVLNAVDTAEEGWLTVKLAYQTWRNDPAAADTALELQMEHMDGGMPGNSVQRELENQLGELSEEAVEAIEKYGDDVIPLLIKYQDDALEIINTYKDEGIAILQKYGDDAVELIQDYGPSAIKVLSAVDPSSAQKLLGTLDDDVLDYALDQGPDAVAALSRWTEKDLEEHGLELALRAEKDAKVLADVQKLVSLGKMDPQHLTAEQLELINQIAANSTQYSDEGQVVLGKWVDIGDGFIQTAKDTGSVYYSPHPDMWNILGELGSENQSDVAWLVNQQVIQTGINNGLPFEYTLNGISEDFIDNENAAVQAIFSGKTDEEIKKILGSSYLPARMKELQELQDAGYQFTFDSLNNSYVLIKP
jgi:Big-like domain-containing protein